MQTVLEQGSIDKPLTFDVGLIQLSFIPVCSLNTCNISVKLCRVSSHYLLVITRGLPNAYIGAVTRRGGVIIHGDNRFCELSSVRSESLAS